MTDRGDRTRRSTALLIGAVIAFLGLVAFAGMAAAIGTFLPMGSDSCASGDPSLICTSRGQGLAIGLPWGCALLGLVVALLGFIPPARFRGAAIAGGYLIVLIGLVAGVMVESTNG